MDRNSIKYCRQCNQRINLGERYVRFKLPGSLTYDHFHCRVPLEDCWEAHLNTPLRSRGSIRKSYRTAFVAGNRITNGSLVNSMTVVDSVVIGGKSS